MKRPLCYNCGKMLYVMQIKKKKGKKITWKSVKTEVSRYCDECEEFVGMEAAVVRIDKDIIPFQVYLKMKEGRI